MISFIVMASGLARRFGGNKLLTNLEGIPVAEYILKTLQSVDKIESEKILVYKDEEIKKLGEKYSFKTVENRTFQWGQSESIKLGVEASSPSSEGYIFFVADQPFVSCETIMKIAEKGLESKGIVIPVFKEKRGNPVFFANNLKEELLLLEGDFGGKEVIANNQEKITFLEIEDKDEIYDIDTKEDLDFAKCVLRKRMSIINRV